MSKRPRIKHTLSFKDRLALWAAKIRDDANKLRPGPQRDELLKKASQADVAAHLDEWANSPESQPPK